MVGISVGKAPFDAIVLSYGSKGWESLTKLKLKLYKL